MEEKVSNGTNGLQAETDSNKQLQQVKTTRGPVISSKLSVQNTEIKLQTEWKIILANLRLEKVITFEQSFLRESWKIIFEKLDTFSQALQKTKGETLIFIGVLVKTR